MEKGQEQLTEVVEVVLLHHKLIFLNPKKYSISFLQTWLAILESKFFTLAAGIGFFVILFDRSRRTDGAQLCSSFSKTNRVEHKILRVVPDHNQVLVGLIRMDVWVEFAIEKQATHRHPSQDHIHGCGQTAAQLEGNWAECVPVARQIERHRTDNIEEARVGCWCPADASRYNQDVWDEAEETQRFVQGF